MELFSNWMFWAILVIILVVFAVIGYMADSKKKNKNVTKEKEPVLEKNEVKEVSQNTDNSVNEIKKDDWLEMPKVDGGQFDVSDGSLESQTELGNTSVVESANQVDNFNDMTVSGANTEVLGSPAEPVNTSVVEPVNQVDNFNDTTAGVANTEVLESPAEPVNDTNISSDESGSNVINESVSKDNNIWNS